MTQLPAPVTQSITESSKNPLEVNFQPPTFWSEAGIAYAYAQSRRNKYRFDLESKQWLDAKAQEIPRDLIILDILNHVTLWADTEAVRAIHRADCSFKTIKWADIKRLQSHRSLNGVCKLVGAMLAA